ncbi:hypothetical protein TR13x_06125 [Caloranaerobacter sp. TR13]|uniref:hypothetical protein n=1 Tax=Caloranaerobacter sp. TR13 TaxID=1302151 RepID=UPI0006D3E16B|nr:hypothetical protein [Caloranaerobacter sp. TR13]KPU27317.1 hypothetical protein TR13x_06125 [Caloranaerobacter sp. TR13]
MIKIKTSKRYFVLFGLLTISTFYFALLLYAIYHPPLLVSGAIGGYSRTDTIKKELTAGINIENQGIFPIKIKDVILKDYNGINIEEIYIVKYDTTKVSTGKVVLGEFKFNNYINKVYNRYVFPNWMIPNTIYKNKYGNVSYPKLYEYAILYNVKTTQKKFLWPRSIKIIYMYLGKKFVVEFNFIFSISTAKNVLLN